MPVSDGLSLSSCPIPLLPQKVTVLVVASGILHRNISHRLAAPESLRHLPLNGAPRIGDKRAIVLMLRFEIEALTRKERLFRLQRRDSGSMIRNQLLQLPVSNSTSFTIKLCGFDLSLGSFVPAAVMYQNQPPPQHHC
jgi:hypothetical protein